MFKVNYILSQEIPVLEEFQFLSDIFQSYKNCRTLSNNTFFDQYPTLIVEQSTVPHIFFVVGDSGVSLKGHILCLPVISWNKN